MKIESRSNKGGYNIIWIKGKKAQGSANDQIMNLH